MTWVRCGSSGDSHGTLLSDRDLTYDSVIGSSYSLRLEGIPLSLSDKSGLSFDLYWCPFLSVLDVSAWVIIDTRFEFSFSDVKELLSDGGSDESLHSEMV